jgi:hypothetical protein
MAKLTKDQKRKKQQVLKRKQSATQAQTINRVRNVLSSIDVPMVDFFDSQDTFDPSELTDEERELKPTTGDVFVSSRSADMKLFIERSGGFEDEDSEYYDVSLIDYANKDNPDAGGDLLSPEEWVAMVKTYGLVLEV